MSTQQHKTHDDRHRRPAFTLIELVLVSAILAVLAGIAVPRFANFVAHRHLEAAARRIATDLALAQRRAKFSSVGQTVSFDVGADAYTLVGMDDPDHPDQPYQVAVATEPYSATVVSADFGGDTEVIFDGYGVPDSDGTIVIQVGSYQRTLTVNAQTGRVSVSDGSGGDPPPPEQQDPPPLEE